MATTRNMDSALILRDTPGLPHPDIRPPQLAEVGDPFATLRVVHLVARIPRGEPVRLRDIVDRLNADYLDWSFSRPVVAAAILQLQANWMVDYRTADGIELVEGLDGPSVRLEDSSRVDPWIVRQAHRLAEACRMRLDAFAIEEGATP
ncbi:MAG: hypothetical protein ACXWQ6_04070 [Candidatus Limnocylindrales bacterium]